MPGSDVFKKRLDELRLAHSEAQSVLLRNYYAHAINLTEESINTLATLVEWGQAKQAEDQQLVDERISLETRNLARIARELDEARLECEAATDDRSRSIVALKLRTIRTTLELDKSGMNTDLFMTGSSIRLQVVPGLAKELSEKILSPGEKGFTLKAAVDSINFVMGLVPGVGNVYSGVLAVYGITTKRKGTRRTADKHVVYLEGYCQALRIWSAAAESAIRVLQE